MASYHLHIKTFGRAGGSSAPGAAAYRAGERIRDERTGRIHDHRERQDVLHKEILVPRELTGDDLGWAKDRATLWNAAEAAERRNNARVAREYLVALPVELDGGSRVILARNFAQELADRYRSAVDVTVHAPRDLPGSDPRNFHAHLLATTREVGRNGLGAKTTVELSDGTRRGLGLGSGVDEVFHVRERWATVTNEALRQANVEARVDHRSLRAQGIDREPKLWIPRVVYEMERRGYYSPVAERIRADYEARVLARAERRDAQADAGDSGTSAATQEARPEGPPVRPSNLADLQRQARENWLRVRQELAQGESQHRESTVKDRSQGRDDDFGR